MKPTCRLFGGLQPRLATSALLGAIAAGLLLGSGGCAVATDFLDPDFAAALGLPTGDESPGSVIVVFENKTSVAAEFQVFAVQDANGTAGLQNALPVAAGQTDNLVYDCPYRISLGQSGADLVSNNVGALASTATGQVAVAFTGGDFLRNDTYSCGDVIVVRLFSTTTGTTDAATTTFSFQVEIIPGG